jgi:hypothetical protein
MAITRPVTLDAVLEGLLERFRPLLGQLFLVDGTQLRRRIIRPLTNSDAQDDPVREHLELTTCLEPAAVFGEPDLALRRGDWIAQRGKGLAHTALNVRLDFDWMKHRRTSFPL